MKDKMDLKKLKKDHPELVKELVEEIKAKAAVEEVKFEGKWLKGLKHRSAESKIVEEDGRKVRKFTPCVRPLTAEDILAWKDYGDHVVMVTSDGQKVRVEKNK